MSVVMRLLSKPKEELEHGISILPTTVEVFMAELRALAKVRDAALELCQTQLLCAEGSPPQKAKAIGDLPRCNAALFTAVRETAAFRPV